MGQNLLRKIISAHLISGKPIPGEEIGLKVDQSLTTDATGTLTFLEFEATGVPRVQVELAVSYIDRNLLETRPEDAEEQQFLRTFAARHGIVHSRPGNGTCCQIHLEQFALPGKTLLGADAHVPTLGALGMLAIGAGGLDVAAVMAGAPFYIPTPRTLGVRLVGQLRPWVTTKDVALDLLRRLKARGGVGRVVEFFGSGLAGLTVVERATIANMLVETSALSVLFPADAQARRFLEAQGRAEAFVSFEADPAADYDEELEVDLGSLEPLAARPGSPYDVVGIREIAGIPVDQVLVGSCANSGLLDLKAVSDMMAGQVVADRVSAAVIPGSRRALMALEASGGLNQLLGAGWRLLETGCGPCLGLGQAPPSGGVSLRTFNRNSPGRSGTPDDRVYLVSPVVAAASALLGRIAHPDELGISPPIPPNHALVPPVDNLFGLPASQADGHDVLRGPHSRPLCLPPAGRENPARTVVLKLDRVGIDDILPITPEVLALRTDPESLADYLFGAVDRQFAARARAAGGDVILVGGSDFGDGPGRELAVLALALLGVGIILAKDFSRIFRMYAIHHGILPIEFNLASDWEAIQQGDVLEIADRAKAIRMDGAFEVRNQSRDVTIMVRHALAPRQKEMLLAGGLLRWAQQFAREPLESAITKF